MAQSTTGDASLQKQLKIESEEKHSPFPEPTDNQIWQNAIQQYYSELRKGGIKGPSIDRDLWKIETPSDLLEEIRTIEPPDSKISRIWIGSLRRLEPVLLGLNDFTAVTAWALGMNGRVAAVIWGSIRLLLNLAQPVLPEILDMLEELRRTLPRYKRYEQDLPMTKTLEDALTNMYTEIIVFCARAITFFRSNPNIGGSRNAWSEFNRDFLTTIENLRVHSRGVDEEVDMIRMRREKDSAETISVMQNLKDLHLSDHVKLPCHVVPFGLNPRFFGRQSETMRTKEVLDPEGKQKLRVLAIHGLGGVGKSQLALNYANTSMKLYDAIIWIPSETQIKMTAALSTFAKKLGLPVNSDTEDGIQSSQKVRDWLNTSEKSFLLVFDNVDNAEMLLQVWPASETGSIIITTRSPSVASKRAREVMHLQSFSTEDGLEVLYSLTSLQPADNQESAAAKEICQLLGGLPLAFAQISDFVRDRGYSYQEFLAVYRKSAAKVLKRGDAPLEYDHTLSTVWELSLEKLPEDAKILQKLLVFFDPDRIQERLLINEKADITDNRFEFLTDEFDFGEAVSALVRASFVNRSSEDQALSVHRLVQETVYNRLAKEEISVYLNSTIKLLSYGFPNTWGKAGPYQGHGYESWETCGRVLPHVNWLIELAKKHKLSANDPEEFAELMFRAGTYLWEKEQPTAARHFFLYGLSLNVDRESSVCNPAVRLLGHIALDMARPRAALEAYYETLAARLKRVPAEDPTIADVYDSIACAYTETSDADRAFQYLDKAKAIHLAKNPSRMARTQAILAMTHLRAGNPDDGLAALRECWRLQGLTEDQAAASKYPKHSGDIVLLSRLYYLQGEKEAAQQLASKSITIRKGILGKKGPRVADSMFLIASILRADNKVASAAKLLHEIAEMAQGVVDMDGHLARAWWTLARLEEANGNGEEADKLKQKAKEVRMGIEGRETVDEDTDEAFMGLVGFMLW